MSKDQLRISWPEGSSRPRSVRSRETRTFLSICGFMALSWLLAVGCTPEVTPSSKSGQAKPAIRQGVEAKTPVTLPAGVEILDDYTRNNLFESGDVYWVWKVVIVPKGTPKNQLVELSRQLFAAFPKKRMRIFDDKAKVTQWVQRDVYFNDKSGEAREVAFPEEWARAHHVGNIHERSDIATGRWQLVSRFGEHVAFLD